MQNEKKNKKEKQASRKKKKKEREEEKGQKVLRMSAFASGKMQCKNSNIGQISICFIGVTPLPDSQPRFPYSFFSNF